MSDADYNFDWGDLAFGSKKPLSSLHATFIAAPRELSASRLLELVKQYLPKGNVVIGISKEPFVAGLEGQPQFRMLAADAIRPIVAKVAASPSPHKLYTLSYFQRETDYILEKVAFRRVVLVRGSWQYAFHNRSAYHILARSRTDYELASPFVSDEEARRYETATWPTMHAEADLPEAGSSGYSEADMLGIASRAARLSYDYSFQTGVALGRPTGETQQYALVDWAYNRVVPYQTYALHHGTSREDHFSPPHDLNHYDTVHAEVGLVIKSQRNRIDLTGTTLFINLLPCPACARMLGETDIEAIVYREDHSNGYAISMLQLAGKTVRRLVPPAAAA